MKNVTIELSRDQVAELSTVITHLTGVLQHRAAMDKSGILDDDWRFWNEISNAISKSFGYEAYMDPTSDLAQSLLNQ